MLKRLSLQGSGNRDRYDYKRANEVAGLHDKHGCSYFGYDQNGNTVMEQTPSYTRYFDWDGRDIMVGVRSTEQGWTNNLIRYDGLASRVSTLESSGFTYYDWDSINVIQEKAGAGTVTDRQVHGYAPIISVGDIAVMDKSGTPYVPVSDQPGTTWNLLDASAAKANSYTYDAYGVARGTSDTVPNKYRFGTKPLDADPAVYHFIARVYCPALGRFIRPDSLGEPSQPSMGLESATMGGDGLYFSSAATRLPSGGRPLPQYVFVSSAPLTHTDPWGLLDYTDILHTGNILVMKEWPGYLYEAVGVRTDKGRYVAAGGRLLGTSHPPNPAYTDPTYWCHGYTFDGVNQLGGPFSLIGPSVLTVLQDDAWRLIRCSCAIPGHDIVVFYHYENEVVHSGKVTHVVVTEGKFDELHSWIRSKHELAALGPSTFIQEVERYNASYSCYASRKNAPLRLPTGPGWGDHERSWSGSGDYYGVPM